MVAPYYRSFKADAGVVVIQEHGAELNVHLL